MSNRKLSVAKTLRLKGEQAILKSYVTGGGSYDPTTGTARPRGNFLADSKRSVILMDQLTKTPSRSYGSTGGTDEINTLIEGVQKWVLMDAMGRPPRMQDHLVTDDDEWHIINVQTTADQTGPVLYVLAVRK